MNDELLYPLFFDPIYQYRIWGGRRFENLLSKPLPEGPIGEAWVLSDRDDFPSVVKNGPLEGHTLAGLIASFPDQMLGDLGANLKRFPLLLKFLDAQAKLSVQVHPSDEQTEFLPKGELGKTEAWVVLETESGSVIYAGLKQGTTPETMRKGVEDGTIGNQLASFSPKIGDVTFIPAGTVHALGAGVMVFEVQENSDVTFRLYDWGNIDPKSGQARERHVEKGLAVTDFSKGEVKPAVPVLEIETPVLRESLVQCSHFGLTRIVGEETFGVGASGKPRVLVCIDGEGCLESGTVEYSVKKGDVVFLPAVVGACNFVPIGSVTVLEVSLPNG